MTDEIRVLLIEDSEDDALLVERNLRKGGLEPIIVRVFNEANLRKVLDSNEFDIVLCDFVMPAFTSEDAISIVQEKVLDVPIIIVSGVISDEVAVRLMKAGVQDYLNKDNLARLAPAVTREIGEAQQRAEKRRAEKALRDSEIKHRMLIESISETVLVINVDGMISEFYGSVGLDFQSDPETMVGKAIQDYLPEEVAELYITLANIVRESNESQSFEYCPEGESHQRCFSASLSPHEDGKRVVVVLIDVTELKRTEEELRATSKIATLYLDLMSHDVRQYLQAIKIAVDLLSEHVEKIDALRLVYEMSDAVEQCDHLISTVQSTRDLLKTPLERMSLPTALSRCIVSLERRYDNVHLDTDFEVSEATIQADKFIELLLMNLLDNAVRHNRSKESHVWVGLRAKNGGYLIIIADDGPGLTDHMKDALFDPDRRFGGVGIHQSVQICEKYGGRIKVSDRVEGDHKMGAQFEIWLPKAEEVVGFKTL